MEDQLETLFLQEKPVKGLLLLKTAVKPIHISIIAREIDSTYAHTLNVFSKLEDLGLIRSKRRGRVKQVELTKSGKKAADLLQAFIDVVRLSHIETDIKQIYEERMKGRTIADIDQETLGHLTSRQRELERLKAGKGRDTKKMVEKLLDKIDEILAECGKSAAEPTVSTGTQ